MDSPAVGSVVLVPFPFSDLSASTLRPALIVAEAGRGDWVCVQITSNPYSDSKAITLTTADFAQGGLDRVSYVRPGKLFTASEIIFRSSVADVSSQKLKTIIEAIVSLLQNRG